MGCPKSVGVAAVGLKCGWLVTDQDNNLLDRKLRMKYYQRSRPKSSAGGLSDQLLELLRIIMQKCSLLPNRESIYMRYSCTETTLEPSESLSCMPPILYTARKPDSVSFNRQTHTPNAEAPKDRALSSFDCHRGHELGRGRQLLGPPDPTRPHDLEIADEENEHELDTAASQSVAVNQYPTVVERTAPWSSSKCLGPAGPSGVAGPCP